MKYTAITIGPIYKTLSEAKRTRAVWAGSYFFSWFIRRILEKAMDEEMNVFLPDTSLMKKKNEKRQGLKGKHGTGFYADRLYFINDVKTSKAILEAIVKDVITEVVDKSEIPSDFISDYLNLHIIEKEIDESALKKGDFPLAILNKLLDNKELHQNYNFSIEENPLQNYFNNKTNDDSFLASDAFKDTKKRYFRSISEIAATSLSRTHETEYFKALHNEFKNKNEDIDFIDELQKNLPKDTLMPYHKYNAVIYADGDNIGALLSEINEKNIDIKLFSRTLFEFGQKAEKIIYDYGGNGIYLGGEDIFTFAPAACIDLERQNTYTLFYLIEKLDDAFTDTVVDFAKKNGLPEPSMSYGIMLSYIKHPLKEAMQQAYKLLEDKAKKGNKNAIGFRFQKHSGQYMECLIDKSKEQSLKQIYKIVNKYSSKLYDKTQAVLSGIIQRFKDESFTYLFFASADNNNLEHFFQNFFNEKPHSDNSNFIKDIQRITKSIVEDYNDNQARKQILYTVLRYIHFLNSKRDN